MWHECIAKKIHKDLEQIGKKAELSPTDYEMIPKMICVLKKVEKYRRHHLMPSGYEEASEKLFKLIEKLPEIK